VIIPETSNRADWPRLVSRANSDATRRLRALERIPVRSVSATGAIVATDGMVTVNAAAGAVTMTLPAVATVSGRVVTVKKIDASGNAVTVDGNGAETIDGAANFPLAAQYDSLTVIAGATEWHII
jgi:tetrahydrodipicolinate N-succinyltransferase